MRQTSIGAQRASRRQRPTQLIALIATLVGLIGLFTLPSSVSAASLKVVIVVGPVEGTTSTYISDARALASQAKSYGATVIQIYSPNATWSRVKTYAQGANLLIYLGHGNGYPSPYPWSPYTKNGMGLNRAANSGNSNVRYYGQYYMAQIHLAANSVVILNHLCYSAGNSEPGAPLPSRTVARQRIDGYGSSFLRTGARAVFAEARNEAGYILYNLFKTTRTMRQIFWASPKARRTYAWSFLSSKISGAVGVSDPYLPSHYYRSVFGFLSTTATAFR